MILTRRSPTWTLCVLTIPQREPYLRRLFDSLRSLRLRRSRWELSLVYNWDTEEEPYDVERRLRKLGKGLPLSVHFNVRNPTIIGGRIQQLALCKSPLICFIDDDVTLHGDILDVLEERLRDHPGASSGCRPWWKTPTGSSSPGARLRTSTRMGCGS
jgi:hypothetical protein